MDRLEKAIQPENVLETDHYETMKTIVEVCKTSGVNFALLCTHTVDMAMTMLENESIIVHKGTYKDGGYFKLSEEHRGFVGERAEEICIAKRLLLLSSDKKFAASKQELRNDLVKGKDNYPRTVSGLIKYLKFHRLHTSMNVSTPLTTGKKQLETAFATNGERTTSENANQRNKLCRM